MSFTAIEASQKVRDLLDRLHSLSSEEENALKDEQVRNLPIDAPPSERDRLRDESMKDKFIALDADKSLFMYNLVRAIGAINVVELGTSFGVSTIYLALAVGQNARISGKSLGEAKVIGTEHWGEKAIQAKKYWNEAGEEVQPWIELREGDVLETLKNDMPSVDFVLFDIWTPMAAPSFDVLLPTLRPGAVLLMDNVISHASGYADLFKRIKGDGSKFKTVTLPFTGGLEMATYWP